MQDAVESRETRTFRISGRVQGVFFRVWTREVALELGLRGTVRNLTDGSVEAVVQGPALVLDAFEKKLWEGPPASRVDGVERRGTDAGIRFEGFTILY